jgi:bifunctional NMN adenylyltransferase/nudix hydrolase
MSQEPRTAVGKYILTIYIGRFSPFHNGHVEVLKRARQRSDSVLVLIGSINQARNPKNPWPFAERAGVINAWAKRTGGPGQAKVNVLGIRDYTYIGNDQWIANVRNTINQYINTLQWQTVVGGDFIKVDPKDVEIRITGADRDASTFYLKFFPDFVTDIVDEDKEVSRFLTATAVRDIYFGRTFSGNDISANEAEMLLKAFLPAETLEFLRDFEQTENYDNLRDEHLFAMKYRIPLKPRKPKLAADGITVIDPGQPYEVMIQTVDAIVIQTGHVLLVKRRSRPGKGLWALPGGHLEPKERLFDACIRELREETMIKVPEPILRSSMIYKDDFDHPERSLRGRVLTKGYLFKLPDFVVNGKIEMPHIKGADDAEKARWVPIDEALKNPDMFFEDHFHILDFMLGKLRS